MASIVETNHSMLASAARHLNVPVEQISLTTLTGDASTRSYFRAQAQGSSVIIAVYSSAFDESECAVARLAKLEAAAPAARLTFSNDPCAHIEVTNLLIEAGLPLPRVLATSGRDAVMLIEDVGDVRLQDWLTNRSEAEAVEAYRQAVKLIVQIQDATETALGADSICA